MSPSPAARINAILADALEQGGGELVNVSTIMPANILLELLGEDIRNRLCSFTGPDGEEYCLRPDMTVPIALKAVETGETSLRYRHSGPVFRFPSAGLGEAIEFVQTGFEWIGGESGAEEDIEGMLLTVDALKAAGVTDIRLRSGDSALFPALIDGLKLPDPWPQRLKKAFTRKRGPLQVLADMNETSRRSPLAQALSALPADAAEAAVEDVFAVAGISPVGGRSAKDVADRLRAHSGDAEAGPVPDKARDAIAAFMEISGKPREGLKQIAKLAKAHSVKMDRQLDAFSARLDALDKAGLGDQAEFGATFGRRFDYYDGLVFEVVSDGLGDNRPVASGGRYDGLVGRLSQGATQANAFGVALRLDRILEALGEGGQ